MVSIFSTKPNKTLKEIYLKKKKWKKKKEFTSMVI